MLCSYGTDYNSMLLDDVNCVNNNYLTIFQCYFSTYIDSGCTSNSYDATVSCCQYKYYHSIYYINMLQIQLGSGTIILILVWYVFREVVILIKDVLRSIVMDSGEQYVIMDLVLLMLELSANNWDITVAIIMITLVCKC